MPAGRVLWPDESVRGLEWTRQMPEPDAVYSINCGGRLVPGDRIRFNLGSGFGGHGDAPLIEAVVEKIEIASKPTKNAITLRVTTSWGPRRSAGTRNVDHEGAVNAVRARGLQGALEG